MALQMKGEEGTKGIERGLPSADFPLEDSEKSRMPLGVDDDSTSGAGGSSELDRTRARAQLNEAIACIQPSDKAAYMEATVRAPRLVDIESNPDHYLEHADFDPWKAAAKIVAYWSERVETFGDRAFLPMTISGDGAMSLEDIDLLKSGFMMVLPKDKQGRPVLFHDRARVPLNGVLDVMSRQRCLFYVLSSVCVSRVNRERGFVILSPLVKTTRKTTLDNDYNERAVKLIMAEVLPIRYVKSHLVILSTRTVFLSFVAVFLQLASRLGVLKSKFTIHNHSQSPSGSDDALRDLQEHGFDVEGIPAVPFGGIFTIGCFREWLADRQRLESVLHNPSATTGATSPLSSETLDINDEETRKRRADASYCRKKRYLKKIEVEVMQEEVGRLREQKETLKEEEARLEYLILQARQIVDSRLRSQVRPTPNDVHRLGRSVPALLGARPAHAVAIPARGDAELLQDPWSASGNGSGFGHSDLLHLLGTAAASPLSGFTIPTQPLPSAQTILSTQPSIVHDALLESLAVSTPAVAPDFAAWMATPPHGAPLATLALLDRRGAQQHEPLESLRQRLALQLLREALERTR